MEPMELVEEIKRAVEYTKQKEYKKAEKLYLELLKKNSNNASVLSFLGLLYFNLGKILKAEKYLEKSYKICESKAIVRYIALCKYYLEKYTESIFYFEKELEDNNNNSYDIYLKLIEALNRCKLFTKAFEYSEKAYELFPFDEDILGNYSFVALQIGSFNKCEQLLKKLLLINQKSTKAWFIKGLYEEILYSDEEAARKCYFNMARYGDKIGGYTNVAISYSKQRQFRKKAAYYIKKAKKYNPSERGMQFLYSGYYLSNREFTKGYKHYIKVNEDKSYEERIWYKRFKRPWTGAAFKDGILFVYGDQGIGDQIQFSRYLPFLSNKFKTVKIMVAPSLLTILKRTFKKYKNFKFYSSKKSLPVYNKSVMMSHVLYYIKKDFRHIPFAEKYFVSDKKKIAQYKFEYFDTDKLKIGICWESGGAGIRDQIHRTLNVELFEDIINMPNTKVYSFQVKPSLENYKKYPNLIDLGATFEDFDDTAAALKNLDVLVTVDTSVAHLAGALGVKTFMILPYCPDWRWFDNDKTTEWYDSITIFKQKIDEDWDTVFERIVKQLSQSIDPLNKL